MRLWQRQFVKFCVVGVLNTAVDFGMYYVLSRGYLGFHFHYLIANVIAFLVAVTNSFALNKRWTFGSRNEKNALQFTKFVSVNLVSLAMYEALLALFVEFGGFADIAGKALGYGLVLMWNFSAYKYWTFRERPSIL